MAWRFLSHFAVVVPRAEAPTLVGTEEFAASVDIIAFADLRGLSVSFHLVVAFAAGNERAELGLTFSNMSWHIYLRLQVLPGRVHLTLGWQRWVVLIGVLLGRLMARESGDLQGELNVLRALKLVVQPKVAHKVNLLFHEFCFDLVARNHCLSQMMAEQLPSRRHLRALFVTASLAESP